jgi:Ca2+/Na+ antiporter
MQPDIYHMHMLVHRQVIQNNSLTALCILFLVSPFMVLSTINAKCSLCNVGIVVIFIVFYVLFYRYLYRKDTLEVS